MADAQRAYKESMLPSEYKKLEELLRDAKPKKTLEVGMAQGGSTVCICRMLEDQGFGEHTAVDPFQSAEKGFAGMGIAAVRAAGLERRLTLIEDYDYLALPRFVEAGDKFDFILLDGWHSFDYTLLDIFYADLLLNDGGILAAHDSGWPSVYRALRFLEVQKPYQRIGPPIAVTYRGILPRIGRRISQILGGPRKMRQAHSRRREWCSLAAYRKLESRQVDQYCFDPF